MVNILVDAGKYSYVKENPFRKYCVSTRAHNTVLIDNEDYKLDRKYFFESRLVKHEKRDDHYYLQTHNHYDYWETTHQRHIYYKPETYLLVIDVLSAKEEKNFKQIFHLHQDLEVEVCGNSLCTVINDQTDMFIQMKSFDAERNRTVTDIDYNKGIEGDIEGYRALGHNEVVENYVLVNQCDAVHVIQGSMFSFNKERAFSFFINDNGEIGISFETYHEIL